MTKDEKKEYLEHLKDHKYVLNCKGTNLIDIGKRRPISLLLIPELRNCFRTGKSIIDTAVSLRLAYDIVFSSFQIFKHEKLFLSMDTTHINKENLNV